MAADDLTWETRETTRSYRCPGFDVVTETVVLPDGTETSFDYLSEQPSVCILPFANEDTVVCIEEWRQAVDRISFGLPVGGVEASDESLEAAARRELEEETGYEADTIDPLVTVEPANGVADSVLHLFVARGCEPSSSQQLDHNESIRVVPTPFEDLLERAIDGDLRDGRAVLAVSYYQLQCGITE